MGKYLVRGRAFLVLASTLAPLLAQSAAGGRVLPLKVISTSETARPAFDLESIRIVSQILWSNDALVTWERSETSHPVVHSFDKDGWDTPAVITIPDAAVVHVERATQGADGSLAACGFALDSAGHRSGFVYEISPDRQSAQAIRMSGLYLPSLIAKTPDGTTWTEGWEPVDIGGRDIDLNAPVIRRFDKEGKLQGGFLAQGFLLKKLPRYILTSAPGYLTSSSTRVGWHQSLAPGPYYEVLLDGTVIEYPAIPMGRHDGLAGLVITEHDDVFAQVSVSVGGGARPVGLYLFRLNRDARQWQEVGLPDSPLPRDLYVLRGAQGNALVFSTLDPNGAPTGSQRLLYLN